MEKSAIFSVFLLCLLLLNVVSDARARMGLEEGVLKICNKSIKLKGCTKKVCFPLCLKTFKNARGGDCLPPDSEAGSVDYFIAGEDNCYCFLDDC